MTTETTAPRRGRPPRTQTEAPVNEPVNEASDDAIPLHPPITPNGFHDEALKAWLIEHYPDLASWIYTGKVINYQQPKP